MDGTIGQIMMFGGNFAPRNWLYCHGQLLSIAQNQAFFSVIGTIYGGDGRTTFAMPDLRGRAAVSAGTGPGLSNYPLGSRRGSETRQLIAANVPSHNHSVALVGEENIANSGDPSNKMLAVSTSQVYTSDTANNEVAMNAKSISQQNVGGNQPFQIIQPVQAVNYVICTAGIFPSRN